MTSAELLRQVYQELRKLAAYFGGLTGEEAAAALGISAATADRMGRFAHAWLQVELQK